MTGKTHAKHADEKSNIKVGAKKWVFYFSIVAAAIILYKVLDNLGNITNWIRNLLSILTPFVVGLVIAYILYLPCRKVEKAYKTTTETSFLYRHARGLSIATVYIMAVIILFIIFSYIIPILIQSLSDLINNIPNFYETTNNYINALPEDNFLRSEAVKNVIHEISNFDYKSLLEMNRLTEYAKSAISAINSIFDIFVSVIVSIYILSQRKVLVKTLARWSEAAFSEKTCKKGSRYFRNGNEIFFRFLTSQITDAFIIGAILILALLLLKVKYAVLLGFMIGVFNLIPFFGAIVAVTIAIIITLLTGGVVQAAIMAAVVIILQQIDANIINPKIVGDSLQISQLLVIFAVTIGGAYFNVLGMFLGVPVATVIKMMIDDFIQEKEAEKKKTKTKKKAIET